MKKTELKFNSQVCTTREQSQRLLDLGLKPETADCMYFAMSKSYHGTDIPTRDRRYNLVLFFQDEIPIMNHEEYEYIPAWSLHRLLFLYGQDYTIKEVYNDAEECYGMLISAIEIAIENDEFNEESEPTGEVIGEQTKEETIPLPGSSPLSPVANNLRSILLDNKFKSIGAAGANDYSEETFRLQGNGEYLDVAITHSTCPKIE